MLAKLNTLSLLGIEALPVEVEVDVSSSPLPKTMLVGLPEQAVKESIHRVERAIVNSGFMRPNDRVVINLAPAELPKQAASFDLPISLGILAGSGQFQSDRLAQYAVVGELALEGHTRSVKGALSMAIAAREVGLQGILVPRENAGEAAVVDGIDVIPISSLAEAVGFFAETVEIGPEPSRINELFEELGQYDLDYADVRGQEVAKRALTISERRHNLLMLGPPGSGKTMLAKRLPSILPTLNAEESIETTRIYSSLGQLKAGQPLLAVRPFRSPHHTISNAGLVGGGSPPAPGEISLAHHGVLFLDELPEFDRRTLEVMRQPLEDRVVTISLARYGVRHFRRTLCSWPHSIHVPVVFVPIPDAIVRAASHRLNAICSGYPGPYWIESISTSKSQRYRLKNLIPSGMEPAVARCAASVETAHLRQADRFAGCTHGYNAQMNSQQLREFCPLDGTCRTLLRDSCNELGLSARAHDKILRVARTIADLEDSDSIQAMHLQEAINYRMLDRDLF